MSPPKITLPTFSRKLYLLQLSAIFAPYLACATDLKHHHSRRSFYGPGPLSYSLPKFISFFHFPFHSFKSQIFNSLIITLLHLSVYELRRSFGDYISYPDSVTHT